MRKQAHVSDTDEITDLDLTPLLDVVFIVLIFFIVSASFLSERGVPLNAPEKGMATNSISIVLEITANNEIVIDGRHIDMRSIKPTLTRLRIEQDNAQVVVRLNSKARTKTFITALDKVRQANVKLPAISLTSS